MPTVPKYQPNQVNEIATPTAAINANTTVENYGGGQANPFTAAAPAIEAFGKVYEEQKKKADQIALYEADAKLSKIETDLLYDKSTGALNKQGKASFDAPEVTSTEYQKRSEEIGNSLNNDEQKAAFKRLQLERGSAIDRTVQRHVGTEIIRYDQNTTMAFVKNELDAASQAYDNPERVQASLNRQAIAISDYAKRNGLSDEEAKEKITTIQSKTHETVIGRMLANDQDMQAEQYFKANKEMIKGDDLPKLEKELETGSLRGRSQRFVDEALKSKMTEAEAIEKARSVEDPKLRDATYERIKTEYNLRDAAKKKGLEDLHRNALNMVDDGQIKDVTKVPGWNEMDVGARNTLKEYFNKKVEGKNIITDYSFYSNLKTMSSTPETQDKFLKMDPMMWRDKLNNGDFEKMVDLQAGLRKGDSKAKKATDGFRSDSTVVKQVYDGAGLPKNDKESINKFNSRVEEQQIAEQERLGRKLNNIELKKIADDQAKEIIVNEGFFFDDTKKFYELNSEELNTIKYKDVPSVDKIKIEKALKSSGRQVSEESVRQLYIKKVLKDRNGK